MHFSRSLSQFLGDSKKVKRLVIVLVGLLLAGQLIGQLYLAKTDSQTSDEGVHLSAGYTYLTRHDYRFNPEHPPLVKKLAALPLLFLHPKMPANQSYWKNAANFFYDSWKENRYFAQDWFYSSGNNANQLLFWGRVPITLLTLILGLAIFFFSASLWGWWGGLLSVLVYVLDPNIAAHGHLITTDIGIALGYLIATFAFWNLLKKPDWKAVGLFGLALGIASLMKFTSVILLPTFILLLIWHVYLNKLKVNQFWKLIGQIALGFLLAWLIIWAGYGFNTQKASINGDITNTVLMQNSIAVTFSPLEKSFINNSYKIISPVLYPRYYFKGLIMVLSHAEGGQTDYFLGHLSSKGWWYYFPVMFSAKTPVATLVLLIMAIWLLIKNEKTRVIASFLLISSVTYLIVAMFSKADLGIRHILPIYPLLFILIGGLVTVWPLQPWRNIIILSLIYLLISFSFAAPHFLAYFNELWGGSDHGYLITSDSSVDWGQDLFRIQNYIKTHNIKDPYIDYAWGGPNELSYYHIQYRPVSQLTPSSTGDLIIGASSIFSGDVPNLSKYKPDAFITPSVLLYHLKGKSL